MIQSSILLVGTLSNLIHSSILLVGIVWYQLDVFIESCLAPTNKHPPVGSCLLPFICSSWSCLTSNNIVLVKTPHGTQKCHKYPFLEYKESQLECSLEASFCQLHLDVFNKMLVACASDNEGRSLIYYERYILHLLLTHSWWQSKHDIYDIKKLILCSTNLYHRCPYKLSFKMQSFFLPKVEVHSTRLETKPALEKKYHMWMWCFCKHYVQRKDLRSNSL